MLADLYNCDVNTARSKEGPALGVALLAGVGAGIYSSVEQACDAVITYNKPQSPDPVKAARYEECYALFRKLYPALKESYAALGELIKG